MAKQQELPPPMVPKEYAGLWIAWDRKLTKIVASGPTFDEACEKAHSAGEADPVLAKVPKANARFVGESA
jgi:Family of unknown function (DUF5678)